MNEESDEQPDYLEHPRHRTPGHRKQQKRAKDGCDGASESERDGDGTCVMRKLARIAQELPQFVMQVLVGTLAVPRFALKALGFSRKR